MELQIPKNLIIISLRRILVGNRGRDGGDTYIIILFANLLLVNAIQSDDQETVNSIIESGILNNMMLLYETSAGLKVRDAVLFAICLVMIVCYEKQVNPRTLRLSRVVSVMLQGLKFDDDTFVNNRHMVLDYFVKALSIKNSQFDFKEFFRKQGIV